ncbi:hypothetical protein Csac_2637 [Caldicellulosiruptor saccharolyticus DSM 8903]|uniref:Uncharacterized protein n=1 Tax=Caldicellulosiruptor saccharolyticus (strain ATCC 43494 / DSM 8903 / Tp8T 6331) TaxID=351627 RepID=A4XMS3_CALS8|nr:hypothetical protein [Caldicellulosiruptor saccharolyticus]ABP68208.1 hypothetical protein Csac_2637 [Caldicellulosiruptor saccharolyticus DSM 8903]
MSKIAIATGINSFDEELQKKIANSDIIYYREFLLKEQYDTVILSEQLTGAVRLEELAFKLRENGTRLIFLIPDVEDNPSLVKYLLLLGVYDIITGNVACDDVITVLNNPKTFKDISKLLLMVSGAEDIKPVISDRQHKEEQTKEQKQEEKQEGQQPEQNSDQQAQTSEVTEKVVEIPVEKVVEKVVEKEKIVQIEKPVIVQSQSIGIWSVNSGYPTAEIAIEVARSLKQYSKTPNVALLDFEEITPRICDILKVRQTQVEYLTRLINLGELTRKKLDELLSDIDGIKVFGGITIRNSLKVTDRHLITVTNMLKESMQFVVIHGGSGVTTTGAAVALSKSDKLLVIVKPSKSDVIRTLELINFAASAWGVDKSKVYVYLIEDGWTTELDAATVRELCELNGVNFAGAGGKKYMKTINKLINELVIKGCGA